MSNFVGWQLTKAVHLARALNAAAPVTIQPQYSLLARETEWEIVPAALDAGLGLLPWSPLGGGETAALDAASDPCPPDYPYGELGVDQRARALPPA
jgi:aryl-alcohol dehydrogenase-like predicted oxidoreductase